MSENNQLTLADNSANAPALLRTAINPADIDLFQAAVFYRDPLLLKLFSLTPADVQLKDQLAVMGKFNADRNAQRRHDQSKVNKQLKADSAPASGSNPNNVTLATATANPSAPATFFRTTQAAIRALG